MRLAAFSHGHSLARASSKGRERETHAAEEIFGKFARKGQGQASLSMPKPLPASS